MFKRTTYGEIANILSKKGNEKVALLTMKGLIQIIARFSTEKICALSCRALLMHQTYFCGQEISCTETFM